MTTDNAVILEPLSLCQTLHGLHCAGFALHWLHAREKRPIGNDWSTAPVATWDQLQTTYRRGMNVGVRLGQPSHLAAGGYLHVFDIDIRVADLTSEAWQAFRDLFPGVNLQALPSVLSGSGGESRHIYFIADEPLAGRKLAFSDSKIRNARGGWSYSWEIELFSTGKQVVLPPSIHPDTGLPYQWLQEIDLEDLEFGLGPWIPMATLEAAGAVQPETFGYETREALDLKPGQMERELGQIDISSLDYDDWVRVGQAIHHQTGGSAEGLELWIEHTKRSSKYVGLRQDREMRRVKWRSFGRYRGNPVTFATIRSWAADARSAALVAEFDDLDDPVAADDFDDLIGTPIAATVSGDMEAIAAAADANNPLPWQSLLDYTENSTIKSNLHNLRLIIENDARMAGLPQLNEFTHETVQRCKPGTMAKRRQHEAKPTRQLTGRIWTIGDATNGDLWSDDRDFDIRSLLEAPKTQGGYGLKVTDRDLKHSITLCANESAFHPVKEYLESLTWDGVPRAETLFIRFLGAEDDQYNRDIARLMLVAAVTRIFEPGHKFDFAVIMEGLQGKGKSTFIKVLGRSWFAELNGNFHDSKQMIELMQGAWIMEIPELSGFGRGEVQTIKAFISTTKDKARLAYARRAGEFPRQCIFIGSTNDREYLKDDTGGRRFWPVACSVASIDTAALEREIDQVWGEAVALYRAMRAAQPGGTLPLYLTDDASIGIAVRLQESRRAENAEDGVAGQIAAWLDQPVHTGDAMEDGDLSVRRNQTCLMQIWVECLGSPGKYDQAAAQSLGRAMRKVAGWTTDGLLTDFPAPYKRQRFWERVEAIPKWRKPHSLA